MTRHRGYKEKTSKFGENFIQVDVPEMPKKFGETTKVDVIVREDPNGKVVEVLKEKGTRVQILNFVDSKWVQVTTPSGITGVCGAGYIMGGVE